MATLRQTFSNIADAIRAKGVTGTMTPLEMPTKIASIPSGGGTTYGATVKDLIGMIDENGRLQNNTSNFVFHGEDLKIMYEPNMRYKFYYNANLTKILLPNFKYNLGNQTFYAMCYGCPNLTHVDMSGVEVMSYQNTMYNSFRNCTSLVEFDMSSLESVNGAGIFNYTFNGCTSLKRVYFTKWKTNIGLTTQTQMFSGCTALEFIDFSQAAAVPPLSNTNAFNNTNNTFKIVVPDALYNTWVAASNWSSFASHIVKASEYVVPAPTH